MLSSHSGAEPSFHFPKWISDLLMVIFFSLTIIYLIVYISFSPNKTTRIQILLCSYHEWIIECYQRNVCWMNVIMRKWFHTFPSLSLSNPPFLPTFSYFWSKSRSYVCYVSLFWNLGFGGFFWYVYECVCVFTHIWICLIYCMAIIWN